MGIGQPINYHQTAKFVVEIDGIARAGFAECSELKHTVAVVEHWEGGGPIPHKAAGRSTFEPVTLRRGVTDDFDLYNWMAQVANAAAGVGLNTPNYKRNLDIVQKDRDGSELRRWRLHNAFPSEFVAGAWNAAEDANVVESVVLHYDYFESV